MHSLYTLVYIYIYKIINEKVTRSDMRLKSKRSTNFQTPKKPEINAQNNIQAKDHMD